MENKRIIYDFCPRCNGLMKNGTCMACGYEKSQSTENGAAETEVLSGNGASRDGVGIPGNDSSEGRRNFSDNKQLESLQTPAKTSHTGVIVGICIGAALFFMVLCLAIYLIVKDMGSGAKDLKGFLEAVTDEQSSIAAEENDVEDSYEAEDKTDSEDDYVPDAQDEYYVTIVDCLRDDLNYSVKWQDDEIASEDGESFLYTIYPQLLGDIPHVDSLNERIKNLGYTGEGLFEFAQESDASFDFYVLNEGYVTYMDENTVSIVFLEYVSINDSVTYLPRIMDLNIDIKTGDVLSHEEMVNYDDALTRKVYQQNQYQNDTDLDEYGWSDAYIGELLQGYDGVAFYTPVGLEVGFNYDDDESGTAGWLTVTIKETEKYGKREWP
ncbi:MAG: hypothetical protein Q4C58_10135 [Eubacteriales bacterium]|nr:hypothetical protein [Eubacteriales bacterium]